MDKKSNQRYQLLEDRDGLVYARFPWRPISCTVSTYDYNGNSITLSTQSGVHLGVQLVMSGDAGYSQSNRRVVPVYAPISGIDVGDNYQLRNSSSQTEFVKILSTPTNGQCAIGSDLQYDYSDGDTLEDVYVKKIVFSTEIADKGTDYRCRFEATNSNGDTEVRDVIFDVVASTFDQPITEENLSDYDPLIANEEPDPLRGTTWEDLLQTAWNLVYTDLLSTGDRPNLIMDTQQLAGLQLYKFKQLVAESGIRVGDMFTRDAVNYFQAKYDELFNRLVTKQPWVDKNEDLKPTEEERDIGTSDNYFKV